MQTVCNDTMNNGISKATTHKTLIVISLHYIYYYLWIESEGPGFLQ